MTQHMPVSVENTRSAISPNKFHCIFGGLAVALEATFDSGTELRADPEFSFPALVHLSHEGLVTRVYFPACISGDVRQGAKDIRFVSWLDQEEVRFYRIVFRTRESFRGEQIVFAREGETKSFQTDSKKPYINLDFFSKRGGEFLPLFVKMTDPKQGYREVYLKITASLVEDDPLLTIVSVEKTEVPNHLVN